MKSPRNDIEQRARELYREASQHVDPVTAGRLRAVRREALASVHATRHRSARWLIPTGALAMLALSALMVWPPSPPHAPSVHTIVSAGSSTDLDSELPPDADQTDPNLYQDLDFYGWLAANSNQPAQH